ncbi:MAG: hypothetical protein IKJ07_05510 [Clostridia bacterium]|nr:hypothetical protein [Clostridia bacterium]
MIETTREYVIKANTRNKVKELLILLASLVLMVFMALFDVDKFRGIIPSDSTMDNFVDNTLLPIGKILSYILIPIIFFCLIICIIKIFRKKNLLYINEKGFEENISKQALGFVEWSDVEYLTVKPFFNAKMYGIKLKNPEKYNIHKKSNDGHILFTSQYFIEQADEVEKIIKFHIEKNNIGACTHNE